jgi:hypothetical protein
MKLNVYCEEVYDSKGIIFTTLDADSFCEAIL